MNTDQRKLTLWFGGFFSGISLGVALGMLTGLWLSNQ